MTPTSPPGAGFKRAGARLPVDEYTRRLWHRRYFVSAYATASNAVGYEGSFLGQAWQVLTPLFNIAVYYLVFGLLLRTNRGVPNFIAFLSVGVLVFGFCTTSLTAGSKAITVNLGLVRALQFPRAVLPLSTSLVAFLQLLYSLAVLVPILLISGEPITWSWLELVPAVALQTMFCVGLTFFVARLGAKIPDTSQVLPFISRIWTYVSGIMYSVTVFTAGRPGWIREVLMLNPGYVYISLARGALLVGNTTSWTLWITGFGWGVVVLATGYLYFWRGEEEYSSV